MLDIIQQQIQQAAEEMRQAAQEKDDAELAQQQLFGNPNRALMQMVYGSESAEPLNQEQEDFQECAEG